MGIYRKRHYRRAEEDGGVHYRNGGEWRPLGINWQNGKVRDWGRSKISMLLSLHIVLIWEYLNVAPIKNTIKF